MKYKLLKAQYIQINGSNRLPLKVYKIIALRDFEVVIKGSEKNNYIDKIVTVKEGDIGGYIQSETNLSQDDNSWVFNTACVFENSTLENSAILDSSKVCGNSKIVDSTISGKARVFGTSIITNSLITDNVDVSEGSNVVESHLYNGSKVNGKSTVKLSKMYVGARVNKNSQVTNCIITDQAEITQGAICENCNYSGQTFIKGGQHMNETLSHEVQLEVVSVADPNRKDF